MERNGITLLFSAADDVSNVGLDLGLRFVIPWVYGALCDYPVRRQPKYRVRFSAPGEDAVPSTTEITVPQLSRLIGLPHLPAIIDVRADEEFASHPRLIPGSWRRAAGTHVPWGSEYTCQSVIIVCKDGLHLSQGIGTLMRQQGIDAQTLEGGYDSWRDSGQLLVRADSLPEPDEAAPRPTNQFF